MKSKILFILFIFLMVNNSMATQPETIKNGTREKTNEYITKNNIKFNIDDYVGEWYSEKHQFNFNKNLTFQYDVGVNGKCKLIDKNNNSILMEYIVDAYDNIMDNVYLSLSLNYDFNFRTKNTSDINISMFLNQNKECVLEKYKDYQKECTKNDKIDRYFSGYKNIERFY